MRTNYSRAALFILPFSLVAAQAAPIQNLTFTEVVKDVFVIDAATKKETPAKAGETLVPPNVLKTGPDSRAELVAEDKTVTRVGSNTIFSVEANSRDVNLAQGSVLFHSPAGRGGGRIKSAGATASVLGTTLTVSANASGGFKTSLLEGKGEVRDPKGGKVGLVAGQVTFAKPGGGLSPALNFDLKAQVANSKLVGGFSTPLASIAKIEAAVSVQQAKIAGGALVSTGMLIGDRPDTAFKVDPSIVANQVRLTERQELAREEATKERSRFFDIDPRFQNFVLNDTRNSLVYPPLTDDMFNAFFYIDGTGRTVWRNYEDAINDGASVGVPTKLPGNRLGTDQIFYPLIQKNITITLNADTNESGFFLPTPVDPDPKPPTNDPDTLPKDFVERKINGGLVALDNIKLGGNFEFVNLDNVESLPNGVKIGLSLLLTAGRTLQIDEGSQITSKGELFEIYAGGTQLSRDKQLVQRPLASGETAAPFSVSTVKLVNDSQGSDGMLRITAPSISLTNTHFQSSVEQVIGEAVPDSNAFTPEALKIEITHASGITLESTGVVSVLNDETALKAFQSASESNARKSVYLGFRTPNDIALDAFRISITSKTSTVSLTNVNLISNQVSLIAEKEINLVDTVIEASHNYLSQTEADENASGTRSKPHSGQSYPGEISVIAGDNILISSTDDPSRGNEIGDDKNVRNRAWFMTNLGSASIRSDRGDVRLQNVWFGDAGRALEVLSAIASGDDTLALDTSDSERTPSSSLADFHVKAAKAVLLTNTAIVKDVVLFEGDSVQASDVKVFPNDREGYSKIEVKSKEAIRVSGVSRFYAYKIDFNAQNEVTGVQAAGMGAEGNFTARAVEELNMKGVDLRYAQNVALEANTVILADVSFKEGSNLSLTSRSGVLSTPENRSWVTKGWVNILPRVMYETHDLHDLKNQMGTFGTASGVDATNRATKGIPSASVGEAIKAQFDKALPITVKAK